MMHTISSLIKESVVQVAEDLQTALDGQAEVADEVAHVLDRSGVICTPGRSTRRA